QPELEDDQHQHGAEDAVDDGQQLVAGGSLLHTVLSSTPEAYTAPLWNSRRMRGSGRRGGPAIGRPVARSKYPWWHGQRSTPSATSGRTAQARCVHLLPKATKVWLPVRTSRHGSCSLG